MHIRCNHLKDQETTLDVRDTFYFPYLSWASVTPVSEMLMLAVAFTENSPSLCM